MCCCLQCRDHIADRQPGSTILPAACGWGRGALHAGGPAATGSQHRRCGGHSVVACGGSAAAQGMTGRRQLPAPAHRPTSSTGPAVGVQGQPGGDGAGAPRPPPLDPLSTCRPHPDPPSSGHAAPPWLPGPRAMMPPQVAFLPRPPPTQGPCQVLPDPEAFSPGPTPPSAGTPRPSRFPGGAPPGLPQHLAEALGGCWPLGPSVAPHAAPHPPPRPNT